MYAPTLAPESVEYPPEVFITPLSRSGIWATYSAWAATQPASGVLSTDVAYYMPIFIPRTVIARRLFAPNGATAGGTNNRDLGLYRSDSNRLPSTRIVSSGAVAISGASVCQYYDLSPDITLYGPAIFYVACLHSGTTDTVLRASGVTALFASQVLVESVAALPATATPQVSTQSFWPLCGMTLRSTP